MGMPAPSLLTAVAASTPRSAAGPASLDRRRAVRVSSSFSLLEDGLGVSISGNGTPLCNCGSAYTAQYKIKKHYVQWWAEPRHMLGTEEAQHCRPYTCRHMHSSAG